MRHNFPRSSLLGFTLALLTPSSGCDKPKEPTTIPVPDGAEFRSGGGPYDYCDLFPCTVCPISSCPPGGTEVHYCCDEIDCYEVAAGTTCPTGEFSVICNWGQTNRDGTFTCYDPVAT